jgi:hypothetical protein
VIKTFLTMILALAAFAVNCAVVTYSPGTTVTFGPGKFNNTIYLNTSSAYDLYAVSVLGTTCPATCAPDMVQLYTIKGVFIADIALHPATSVYDGITVMLPAGSYQVHLTGDGYNQVQLRTTLSK